MKRGPIYKLARRLGPEVHEKAQTQKFAVSEQRRGERVYKHPRQESEYAKQLRNKQKVRYSYGISERQFARYVKEAASGKGAAPSAKLLETLETRLDNVVYRLGLASTRPFARQLVSHGHITVNGRRATIPSRRLVPGDRISVREGSRSAKPFSGLEERMKGVRPPSWITVKGEQPEAAVASLPTPENAGVMLDLDSVIDFYSR